MYERVVKVDEGEKKRNRREEKTIKEKEQE